MGREMIKRMVNFNRGISISEKISLMKFDSHLSLLFLTFLIIISNQGASQQKSTTSRQRWLQYQTALSNTGILGGPSVNVDSTTTSSGTSSLPTTSASPTNITRAPTTTTTRPTSANNVVRSNNNINSYNSNRNSYFGGGGRKRISSFDGFPDGALFENNTSVNLTVPLGDTAFLRCRVKNLGERSISWIRRRDWHILTTGKTTYTNDERFHVLHSEGTDDWTLQVKFVQQRDNGTYECQISTGTGIISFMVNLMIAVPEAFILGNGDEYHVEQGSTINLVCVIEKSPKVPEYIFWYHNERMINYGSSREVTVKTEPGARTQSRLTIRDARISDSGNYTCKTAHAEPASIFVYVSQASGLFSGDKIAAIQRRKTSTSSASPFHIHPLIITLPLVTSIFVPFLQLLVQTASIIWDYFNFNCNQLSITKLTKLTKNISKMTSISQTTTFPVFLSISQFLLLLWTVFHRFPEFGFLPRLH